VKPPVGKAAAAPPLGVKLGTVVVPPPPTVPLYDRAIRAFQVNDYAGAERLLRRITQMDPQDAQAWANLGLALTPQRKFDDAIGAFRKAIATHPNKKATGPFWEELTRLYAYTRRWPECVAAARQASVLGGTRDPDGITAYLGMALANQKKFAEALPVLRKNKRLRGEPETAPEVRLIYALRQTNQTKEAVERARKLAGRNPKDAGLQMLLADLEDRAGNFGGAGAAFTRAWELDPADRRAGINAAIAAERRGDRARAEAILRKLIARYPDDTRLHLQLGILLYSGPAGTKEQFKAAEEELKIAVFRGPKSAPVVAQLGLAVMLQGPDRFNDATNYFRSALTLDPNLATAHMGLGYIAEQKNDAETAIEAYRTVTRAGRTDDDTAKARRRLAGLLYATGKKDEAYKEFEILARPADARGTAALAEMASLLLADGKLTRAEEAYKQLVARRPRDPQAYLGLGQTLERLKKPAEARTQYAKALEVDPKNDTAVLLLGGLLKTEKKGKEAVALYEKLLAGDPTGEHNQVRRQLASEYEERGRVDDALKMLGTLTRRKDDPSRMANLLARPQVMLAHNRAAEAVTELIALRDENPKEDDIRYALADAQEKAGRPDAAERTLTEVLARHRNAPKEGQPARILQAELLERQKRLDEAAGRFEDALRIDPLDVRALPGLNRVREKQKRSEAVGTFLEENALSALQEPDPTWTQAVERQYTQYNQPARWAAFAKRAADKYPNNRPSLLRRVAVLLPDGLKRPDDLKEMDTLLTRLLTLDPNDARGRFFLGRVREAQGRTPDAIAEYTRAAQLNPVDGDPAEALRRLGAPVPAPGTTTPAPKTTSAGGGTATVGGVTARTAETNGGK
jgi:superkiller protein 3